MAFIYITLVLVTLATLLYYYFTRTFNYWKDRGVAGPTPVPLFGNLMQYILRQKNIGIVFKEIYDAYPNEKVVGIYRMTTPCLLIRDLDITRHVMTKDFDAFVDRGIEMSKEGLGVNLFHSDGDTWRVLRNRFSPIFSSGKLKNMLYLMTERGDDFIKYVEKVTNEQLEHDVHALVQKFTVATISACAFGVDIDTQNDIDAIATLQKIDKLIFNVSFASDIDMMYPGILKKFNTSIFPAYASNFFYSLVRDVVRQRNGTPTNRKDFMDLILELRQQKEVHVTKKNENDKQLTVELTEHVMAAQAFIFYAGGYETGATTMSFMLYELAKNPDIQEKLIDEIDQVLMRHDGKVTYETLQDMTYFERVFDETLRMYPIVESMQRVAHADYKLPGTNLTITKGTTVLVSIFGIHHDKNFFSDPEKFDPDRHNPENSQDRDPGAYMPFGAGPRSCIGMRFAKLQSRVCIVKLLSKFRVQMSKNTPTEAQICPLRIILGPKNGIRLNIVRR